MLTLQSIYGLTEGNRSWKFGPSTHNQWMEWLWRDVYRCVAATYHELNPAFGLYLFVLHYVIAYDKSVLRFIHRGLESKPICTERMWRKIWINGVLREAEEGHHIDFIPDCTQAALDFILCEKLDWVNSTRSGSDVSGKSLIGSAISISAKRLLACYVLYSRTERFVTSDRGHTQQLLTGHTQSSAHRR